MLLFQQVTCKTHEENTGFRKRTKVRQKDEDDIKVVQILQM